MTYHFLGESMEDSLRNYRLLKSKIERDLDLINNSEIKYYLDRTNKLLEKDEHLLSFLLLFFCCLSLIQSNEDITYFYDIRSTIVHYEKYESEKDKNWKEAFNELINRMEKTSLIYKEKKTNIPGVIDPYIWNSLKNTFTFYAKEIAKDQELEKSIIYGFENNVIEVLILCIENLYKMIAIYIGQPSNNANIEKSVLSKLNRELKEICNPIRDLRNSLAHEQEKEKKKKNNELKPIEISGRNLLSIYILSLFLIMENRTEDHKLKQEDNILKTEDISKPFEYIICALFKCYEDPLFKSLSVNHTLLYRYLKDYFSSELDLNTILKQLLKTIQRFNLYTFKNYLETYKNRAYVEDAYSDIMKMVEQNECDKIKEIAYDYIDGKDCSKKARNIMIWYRLSIKVDRDMLNHIVEDFYKYNLEKDLAEAVVSLCFDDKESDLFLSYYDSSALQRINTLLEKKKIAFRILKNITYYSSWRSDYINSSTKNLLVSLAESLTEGQKTIIAELFYFAWPNSKNTTYIESIKDFLIACNFKEIAFCNLEKRGSRNDQISYRYKKFKEVFSLDQSG